MSSKFQNDAIFWVEVEKIKPNPYQPRRNFNEERLRDLAESIRQYGVLQPLTVTRKEHVKEDGGLKVEYELIAGERRHRASQLANLSQVPVIIRSGEEDSQVKLELAIIENLQREDLNPIERAEAFDQLAQEFEFTHKEIAKKIGKSREYVSNSMRLLKLPEDIKQAIINGQMTEGHARPIMMLRDKPQEQETLFKEVVHKGLTVREAESIARRDAQDKVRKKKNKINPQTKQLEDRLSDTFGTRVKIEERDNGGKLVIDFFTQEDLENIIKLVKAGGDLEVGDMMEQYVESVESEEEGDTGEDQNESETEGKSMAETLGTMIAAARKQHAEKEAGASKPEAELVEEVAERVEEPSTQEESQSFDVTDEHESPEVEKTPESTQSLEMNSGHQEREESPEPDNQPVTQSSQPITDEDVDMNTMDTVVDTEIDTTQYEPEQTNAGQYEAASDTENIPEESEKKAQEISADPEQRMNTDEENSEPEGKAQESDEEEMYSVSNFSI